MAELTGAPVFAWDGSEVGKVSDVLFDKEGQPLRLRMKGAANLGLGERTIEVPKGAFILLRGKGEVGAFVDGFLNLPLAAVIVGFHNTWSGIPVVLTLVGWGLVIKSLIRFCAPKLALRIMARVSVERSWEFQAAGAGLVALAGLLGYGVYVG